MKHFGLYLFVFALTACGGGAGDSSDGGDQGGDLGNGTQAIDCSADKSQNLSIPVPEYAGSFSAYQGGYSGFPVGGGLDPENLVGMAQLGILLMVSGSNEGIMHPGPRWTNEQDQPTKYLDYSHDAEGEIWLFTQDGYDAENELSIRMEQSANCGYNEYQYEDGHLVRALESSKYEWTLKGYTAGVQDSLIETQISADRSGRTVAVSLPVDGDHPYTIMTWDSNGENVLLKYCETAAGTNCASATAP
ncbi:hypothetical protein [Thalassolituus alkanivorans]|uniref:hypothetical protein n=1 Tax=Thalassolituus alkanivorans TaxID=2881055 RepID=UPI001E4FB220|nr:hypothetical protein [Thalassolituus alkanivorans]MCB2386592.1 hypothetical protein [Thalassolituus alkanivorans]MCB2424230.1 hypothetical protein [Thalassolituus alkanivorans]